jgi:hypothetical protein
MQRAQWHHMMLTGALEYENLSVIGMLNKTLVLCQTDGLTAVQSGAQLPSCQQCCIHILLCRETAADFQLVAVLVKVPCVCKGRRSYPACCLAGATQQVMQNGSGSQQVRATKYCEHHVSPVNIPRCNVMHAVHMHEQLNLDGLLGCD